MSQPSCASRSACDRPWPRAAPVTKATLPSSSPMLISLAESLARASRCYALRYQRTLPFRPRPACGFLLLSQLRR